MTITTLYTIHGPNAQKVERIMEEMRKLGPPAIRVVNCGDHYFALEGCHRLAAAARLGIASRLVILEQDDLVAADSLDWQDLQSEESYSAGELVGERAGIGNGCYNIDEDGLLGMIHKGAFAPCCDE